MFVINLIRPITLLSKEITSDVLSLFSHGRSATTLKFGREEQKWALSLAGGAVVEKESRLVEDIPLCVVHYLST